MYHPEVEGVSGTLAFQWFLLNGVSCRGLVLLSFLSPSLLPGLPVSQPREGWQELQSGCKATVFSKGCLLAHDLGLISLELST